MTKMRGHRKSSPSPWARIIGECRLKLSNELAPCNIPHLVALGLELSQAYENENDRCGKRHRLGDRCCPSFHLLALSFDFMLGALQVLHSEKLAKSSFATRSLDHLTRLDTSGCVYRREQSNMHDPGIPILILITKPNYYQWDWYLDFIGARFCGTILPLAMRIYRRCFSRSLTWGWCRQISPAIGSLSGPSTGLRDGWCEPWHGAVRVLRPCNAKEPSWQGPRVVFFLREELELGVE